MSRYYLLIGILLFLSNGHSQQCTLNSNIPIPDNGKSYSLKIEANTTNSGPRVLCGVRLAFEHEFADEMRFVLVSPSGKQVTLIAGKSASSRTSGSSWNVLFVRPGDTAHPDDFKKPRWNDNKWSEDQQYIGSYYPDDDIGLSHFDGDRLTGTWNLIYADKVKGGKGILKNFQLIFCNPPVFCSPCSIPRDFLIERDYGSFCGGDPALIDLQPSVNQTGIQPGYEYTFLVLGRKNRIILRGQNPDLSQLQAGTYKIIAVQYRPENSDLLAGVKDQDDLSDLFYGNTSSVCGAYSNASNEITILSNPGVQNVKLDVYGRDFVIIDGQYISGVQSVTQTYTDRYGCDSIVRIQIDFKEYNPVFTQDKTYDCDNPSVQVSVSTEPEFPVHRWYTRDGKINNQSDIKSTRITADAPGTYFVVFEIEDYLDTASYTLRTDPGSPVITLSNEYTLCSSIPLSLSIGSNYDTAYVKPSSTASISGNKLVIQKPDLYTVTVHKGNCELVKHVLVQPSSGGEIIQIDDAILSCPSNPVTIAPALPDSFENYSWSLQGTEIATTKNLSTNKPGLYAFRAYEGNDCGISGTAWVQDNVSNVDLHIKGPDLINCANENKNNRLTAVFNGDFEAGWTLPTGATVTGSSAPVVGKGRYEVRITDDTGCTFTATQDISINKEIIDFTVRDEVVIPCSATTALVTAEIMATSGEYDIRWIGASPGNPGNTATVNSPGIVNVTATHRISQCSQTKAIQVRNESGKPELSFDPGLDRAISCKNPVRVLPVKINNCDNCEPVLTTSNVIIWENGQLTAREPGTVNIQLDNGTCISNQSITFPDHTKARKLELDIENIGCTGKWGRIKINNPEDYSSIEFRSDQDTFFYSGPINNIDAPATWQVVFSDKENGCMGQKEVRVIEDSKPPDVEYEPVVFLECNSGEAILSVKGDDIENIYWFDPDSLELPDKSTEIRVSQAGTYRVVVFNEEDCFQDFTIDVKDDRSAPSLDQIAELSYLPCDKSVTGKVPSYDTTGIDSVIWYRTDGWSSTSFFPVLEEGEYLIVAVGRNGCITSKKTQVEQGWSKSPPRNITPPITCRSPFSRVHLEDYTGVDQIQWIDESGQASLSDSFDVYNPGRISLTIRQDNGCLVTRQVTVKEDKSRVPFKINEPVIDCHNLNPILRTKITEDIDRPVFYQWYFGETPVGRDATYEVEYPGDYKVEVSFDNGCIDSLSYTVRVDTSAVEFPLRTDTISCSRSKIQLRKSISTKNLSKASWTGPSGFTSKALRPSFQLLGIYQVSYEGENGCTGIAEMEIFGDTEPPGVDSVDYLSIGCKGKAVDLTYYTDDSVKTQYWQLPGGQNLEQPVVQISAKGDYVLYLEGTNGCERIDTFTIDRPVSPKFELEVFDADCLDQTGNALFLPDLDTFIAIWQDPTTMNEMARGPQSPDLAAGTYLVTVLNPLNDCDTTTTFEIKDITDILEADITIDDSLRCERSQANLLSSVYPPSDHYVYEWRYGNQSAGVISQDSMAADISREGLYYLTATDTLNHCAVQATYHNVRAPSRLRSFDLFLTEPACDLNRAGYAIVDSVNGASDMSLMNYSINGGPYISRDTFPFLYANESYDISAKDQYGCTLDTLLMPELRGVMDRTSGIPDTTINSGDTINFNDPAFKISYTSPDAPMSEQYTWILNPDTLSCDYDCTDRIQKQLFHSRTVAAVMTNQFGCSLSDTFNIHVREGDVLDVPNGIIPVSSNPSNSHACVYTNKYVALIELYIVFDRLGNVIFRRSDFDPRVSDQTFVNCWNGRDSQDRIYPPGSYNYYVRYKTVYGEVKQRFGNIFLVR